MPGLVGFQKLVCVSGVVSTVEAIDLDGALLEKRADDEFVVAVHALGGRLEPEHALLIEAERVGISHEGSVGLEPHG